MSSDSLTRSIALSSLLCRCQLDEVVGSPHLRDNRVKCGALVMPSKRLEHLRDCHGYDLASVDRLDELFTPVDPDQGTDSDRAEVRVRRGERALDQCNRCRRPAVRGQKLCEHHRALQAKWKTAHLSRKAGDK